MSHSSTTSSDPAPNAGSVPAKDDDLIRMAPWEALPRSGRFVAVCAVVVTLAVLVGTAVFDFVDPAPLPKVIGQEAAAESRKAAEANVFDGSWMQLQEDSLRRSSRTRFAATPYWAGLLYRTFGDAGKNGLAGSDGWMFMRGRTCAGRDPDALAPPAAAVLSATVRRLEALGIRVVVGVVPRKEAVYADLLPRGVEASPAFEPLLQEWIAKAGVRAPDLWTAFLGAKSRPVYRRTDTHWNDEGGDVAAEAMVAALPEGTASRPSATTLRRSVKWNGTGDLLRTSGLARVDRSNPMGFGEDEPRVDVLTAKGAALPRDQGPPGPTRAVLVGTSFSTGSATNFVHLLGHYLREPVFSAARPAGGPVAPLTALLDRIAEGKAAKPEWLFWEIPSHYLFNSAPLDGVQDLFAGHAPADMRTLDLPGPSAAYFAPGPAVGRIESGAAFGVSLRQGAIEFAGGGELSFRVRLRSGADRVRVVTTCGATSTAWNWPRGKKEMVVPLLAANGAGEARISLRAVGGVVDVEELALVTDLDLAAARFGGAVAKVAAGAGFEQTSRLDAPVAGGAYGHALFRFAADSGPPASLVFEASDAAGVSCGRRVVSAVRGGAAVLVPLRSGSGPVASLRVTGAGPSPTLSAAAVVPALFAR